MRPAFGAPADAKKGKLWVSGHTNPSVTVFTVAREVQALGALGTQTLYDLHRDTSASLASIKCDAGLAAPCGHWVPPGQHLAKAASPAPAYLLCAELTFFFKPDCDPRGFRQ
jgi:uncharacterized protein YhjY with autotransporter beta-barrel domain